MSMMLYSYIVHDYLYFFFHVPSATEIYTLSLHDALPISRMIGTSFTSPGGAHHDLAMDLGGPHASRPAVERSRTRAEHARRAESKAVPRAPASAWTD